ncbi:MULTISPECIES: Rieske 2Fe-2S domain-containing protein [unclassified Caballeronia]|uniref:Rieske (2Fe-2S) protein n=1 Tax=unclassified Caballeronia TaxID=2646786 RepID=UPI00025BCB4E|nr:MULTISPECIES: Rieske 2Fe-2S domain-containing protein [unclassified Caballeronia]EKS70305.1 4-nitrocatechol monooxygenase ferridoxin protein [Burkholderia sp. SJ98]MCE4546424.1 Rieske 2Fe-2S domain-containing protein [Caballeronia sp. PC1]MCE4573102.1 Rieske 2Fe-2S domain-containing protein [Caballeronia sp. CLC5]
MSSISGEQQVLLCALDDVPDNGAIEIKATDPATTDVVIIRRGDEVWAYQNLCPHFSVPLNYEPNTFWTYDSEVIMCAHHSAMFRFEDGLCVDGPCKGATLRPVQIVIEDRKIYGEMPRRASTMNPLKR